MQVNPENPMPVLIRNRQQRMMRPYRRIAHQHIDFPQGCQSLLHQPPALRRFRNIRQAGKSLDPQLPALGRHLLQFLPAVQRTQRQIRPFSGKGQRRLPPDIAARPGNQRRLSRQSQTNSLQFLFLSSFP